MKKTSLLFLTMSFVLLQGWSASSAMDKSVTAQLLQRQTEMENELRELRGRIETLEHRLQETPASTSQTTQEPRMHVFDQASRPPEADTDGTRYFLPPEEKKVQGAEEKFTTARNLIAIRKYAEAQTFLKEIIQENPNHKIGIDAHYWLGEIEFINGRYEPAAVEFGDSYARYESLKKKDKTIKESKAAHSLIQLARCLNKLGKKEKALATLNQYDKEFPNHHQKIVGVMAKRAKKEIAPQSSIPSKS